MGNPQVFISCVSSEFRTTRRKVAEVLLRLGYTPVTQEILGTQAGDLRQVLRQKIDPCMGLIQIVGHAYGAEPPTVDPGMGRVSYTQFELLYARLRGKKTWLVFAGDACNRDAPLERLDLPPDAAHPDPAAHQQERRSLQAAYTDARQAEGDLFHLAGSDAELMLKVEQMKDDLADLRKGEVRWRQRVLGALCAVGALLLLIGAGVWWLHRGQKGIGEAQRDIGAQVQTLAADRQVTREKIRGHLRKSAERAHQAALAEADKAGRWEQRQKLRAAADTEHATRLSRIDELAADFAEIEGSARSTKVFDELTRILADEGVDSALAYVQGQRSGILEQVRARAAAARQKNRDDLLPLLRSAQLCVTRADYSQAAALLNDVLALEPDWPAALGARFWFLIAQADRAATHGTTSQMRQFAESAAAVAQRLVAIQPGNAQWQRDLSVSHDRIGDMLAAQGDGAGALKAYRDGLAIAERLAASDPANTEWQGDLSVSHDRIGDMLRAQGDGAGALKAYGDGLAIAERLVASDPGNTEWQRVLSVSHDNIGDMLAAQGDGTGALKAYGGGLAIRGRLAASDPSNTKWQRVLSVSHEKIGNMLRAQGDGAGALKAYRDGLAIAERLAASDPANTEWQRDLSVSYDNIGDMLRAQGDGAGALKAYRDGLAIAERLVASDPGNTEWQRVLSVSHERIGGMLAARGDGAGALKAYRDGLAIRERLAASDPSNAEWQRDLSVSYERIGDMLAVQGDGAGALKAYRDGLAIRERLAASDPGNTKWQRDLSVSHNKIGGMLAAQGAGAGALKAYHDGLAIAERLAASDPGNAGWQRDLSVSHDNIGDTLAAQGDGDGALKAYRDSLAIRERLAASDPSNAEWQRDLWVSYYKIASALEKRGDAEAAGYWQRARDTLRGIKDRGLFVSPADEAVLKQLEAKVGR